MAGAKTRLTVTVDGAERQILSIREAKNGDLTILPASGDGHDHPDGSIRDTLGNRISIHGSPDAVGHTLVYHHAGEDGSLIEPSTFIHNTGRGFSWPVISKKMQDLSPDKYIANSRGKDDLRNVGTYNPIRSTLLYSLFVADAHRNLDPLPDLADPYLTLGFNKFRLFLFVRYLAIPSLPKGTSHISTTSDPRIDKQPVDELRRVYAEGIPYEEMAFVVHRLFLELREFALRHVRMLVGEGAEAWARQQTLQFFAAAPEFQKDGEGEIVSWFCPIFPIKDHAGEPLKIVYRYSGGKEGGPSRAG